MKAISFVSGAAFYFHLLAAHTNMHGPLEPLLALLADAWHDTARDDVAGLQFHLLGEEVLDHGSHHHLGGLAAREVGDKLGVGLLHHGCKDNEISSTE